MYASLVLRSLVALRSLNASLSTWRADYWPDVGANASLAVTCATCQPGSNCRQIGTRQSTIKTEEGYWRAANSSTLSFYRCRVAEYCTASAAGEQPCVGYRTGPLVRSTCLPSLLSLLTLTLSLLSFGAAVHAVP